MAMIRGEAPQSQSPQDNQHTVVVKLAKPLAQPSAAGVVPSSGPERLSRLRPELRGRPYFFGSAPNPLSAEPPSAAAGEFVDFVAIDVSSREDAERLATSIRQEKDVETAYVAAGPTPPPAAPAGTNPLAVNQGYLSAAPLGINARWAWVNATGAPVGFVDIEQGWTLAHEDLAVAGITLISGMNVAYFGHGTAVLGEVAAVDNALGVIGIAFGGRARVASQFQTDGSYNTAEAIRVAAAAMAPGDVMLLEAQVPYPASGGSYHPVEVEEATFVAIRNAVDRGIVVVEAGGNGSVDLDAFIDVNGKRTLNRDSPDFRDSGAIIVGAASSSVPHSRLSFSNFGSRIDCYAWGADIQTCGDGWTGNALNTYTPWFGGTSGASPIITGAALLVQAWAAGRGAPYSPATLRRLLSDPAVNTLSASPPTDRIGVMPDVRAIIGKEVVSGRASPASARATA